MVSPDSMNSHLNTFTIVPMTSGSKDAPFRLKIDFASRQGYLLADQMRTVDRRRMHKKVGALPAEALSAALAILREMFEDD